MTQRCTPKILAQPRSTETQLGSLNPCNMGWGTLRREALSFLSGSDVDRQILYGFDEDRETSTDGRQAHSKSAGVGAHLKDHPHGEDTEFRPRSKAPQVRTPRPPGELPRYPAEPTSLPIERELKHLQSELGKVKPQSKKLRKFPLRTAGIPRLKFYLQISLESSLRHRLCNAEEV